MDSRTNYEPEEVASFTECTGLMPALPESLTQAKEEAALYSIHPPKKPRRKMKR